MVDSLPKEKVEQLKIDKENWLRKQMNIRSFIRILCLLVTSISILSSCKSDLIKCRIKGEVIDRPQSTQFILYKYDEDPRIHGINIPIIDGKFEYVLNSEHSEKYELAFFDEHESGSWRPISFFSEQGTLNFTLYPSDRYVETRIEGGKLTKEYWDFLRPYLLMEDAIDKEFLTKSKQYLENKFGDIFNKAEIFENDLIEAVEQLKNNNIDIEPIIREITEIEQNLYQNLPQEFTAKRLQYIKDNPTLVAYDILLSALGKMISRNKDFQESNDITPYADLYKNVFAPKYPEHPYSEKMESLLTSLSFKEGASFVDFSAIDLKGSSVKLSDRITGKPAVLNLWASWCGPCRRKGKELIPIYEEFSKKGFVVIGVAREKSIADAETAIKMDKYPWENLIELKDEEKIWEKYGIGNSGGSVFLIDENGIIVAINPETTEIRDFLINKL